MLKKSLFAGLVAVAASGIALAKLPPLDDAAKAKAAETAARNAWQAKVDGYQLCRAQDRVAALVKGGKAGAGAMVNAKDVKTVAAAKDAKSAAPAKPAAAMPAAAPASAAASGTPVALAPAVIPPCIEPGPFAYNPPEQKPLEASGAHSPTGTAASPPSVKENSATLAPKK